MIRAGLITIILGLLLVVVGLRDNNQHLHNDLRILNDNWAVADAAFRRYKRTPVVGLPKEK